LQHGRVRYWACSEPSKQSSDRKGSPLLEILPRLQLVLLITNKSLF
jgi:hypothetical protein